MKKIYTKSVFEFNKKTGKYELNHDESEYHFADAGTPIIEMKGGGGGGGGRQQVIQNTAPWIGQQPFLRRGFNELQSAFIDNPGQTIADFTPMELEARRGILARARAGNPLTREAQDAFGATIRGDYLTGGAGFNAALEAAKNQIIPKVQSQFAARGRTGSGLAQQAEASAIGDVFSGLYDRERARQMEASRLAPAMAGADYNDLDRIMNLGETERGMTQDKLNARRNLILQYMNSIQGNYGGTSESRVPDERTRGLLRYIQGAGGGALMGSSMGPWGAAAGGALGLLGAFA